MFIAAIWRKLAALSGLGGHCWGCQQDESPLPGAPTQATRSPSQSSKNILKPLLRALDAPRVRLIFEQLLEVIHQAEADMEVFDLP